MTLYQLLCQGGLVTLEETHGVARQQELAVVHLGIVNHDEVILTFSSLCLTFLDHSTGNCTLCQIVFRSHLFAHLAKYFAHESLIKVILIALVTS